MDPVGCMASATRPANNDTATATNIWTSPACLGAFKSRVAKLYAKHMKVSEQEAQLRGIDFAFAVGTPNRLLKLADIGALSFDGMQLLIMDVQANEKQQTIFDVKETAFDLVTLYRKHVHRALLAPQSKLQMFLF